MDEYEFICISFVTRYSLELLELKNSPFNDSMIINTLRSSRVFVVVVIVVEGEGGRKHIGTDQIRAGFLESC